MKKQNNLSWKQINH